MQKRLPAFNKKKNVHLKSGKPISFALKKKKKKNAGFY